ncbi:hypothetical protein GQ53DRAFT_747842 [Thozetella sp. PMI_491]|nr:hypothetical protein GQ53DRAFT_747842 [Thozetella sp. PMI_491]
MASVFNLGGLASLLMAPARTSISIIRPSVAAATAAAQRTFTTTPAPSKGGPAPKKKPNPQAMAMAAAKAKAKAASRSKGRKGRVVEDPKIVNMKKHFGLLNPRVIPPPLRMGRNRHLRHWTIHRAWLLYLRQQRDARERNRMRMYQSMYNACEELRLTEGPGTREKGYLYRVAMEKKGLHAQGGIPIEYARAQTDTPAKVAWNHDWKA